MRFTGACAVAVALAVLALVAGDPARGTPLWPGARYTLEDRDRAIQRGLNFIYYSIARKPEPFHEWGHDLLSCFYNIAATSSDPELRRMAWRMGRERAIEWRRINPLPAKPSADDVSYLIAGTDAAERLGVPDPRMRARLRGAAARFSAFDFLLFDPVREPPPADLPVQCPRCGLQNARGAAVCARCGARLKMRDRYDIFQDALICTYTGDRAGITEGAHFRDVLQWLPAMHPYPQRAPGNDDHYYSGVYTATHVVYTCNDYSQEMLSPACFPEEFEHLQRNLREAIADKDPETMGEYLDSLRAFGLTLRDRIIQIGIEYVLSAQNRDGSWGDVTDTDAYARYHPTWTAIDGLRDYRWTRVLPCPSF